MAAIGRAWSATTLLTFLAIPIADAGECALTGPNLLMDTDFAMEAEDPASKHWRQGRHAGENVYRTEFADGELTIRKLGPQEYYYIGQQVPYKGKKGVKMAAGAELKLDLTPVPGPYAHTSSGGLDIAAISASGNAIWSSRRNHQPRIGKTDWEKVQVVFTIPHGTTKIDIKFLHEADGTMQVRKPSLRKVDERNGPCPVTPDMTAPSDSAAETTLR